jgi:hypothetical protein
MPTMMVLAAAPSLLVQRLRVLGAKPANDSPKIPPSWRIQYTDIDSMMTFNGWMESDWKKYYCSVLYRLKHDPWARDIGWGAAVGLLRSVCERNSYGDFYDKLIPDEPS